jgi:hypothetical protein
MAPKESGMEKLHQDVGEIKGKLDSPMYSDDRKRLDAVEKRSGTAPASRSCWRSWRPSRRS